MNDPFTIIEDVAEYIFNSLKNKVTFLYATNAVGKTSISKCIYDVENDSNNIICYNAFVEEYFIWHKDFENEEYFLTINDYDTFIQDAIIVQGLDTEVNKNFRSLINSKIDADFQILNNRIEKISFSLQTGDDSVVRNIKISKGEECLFIWSVFLTILEQKLSEMLEDSNCSFPINYVIIDDPVTSLEDEKIVSIALQIRERVTDKLKKLDESGINVRLLVTTHNKLFYNILYNELSISRKCVRLIKNNNEFYLIEQNDSPFGYHLEEIKVMKEAVNIKKVTKNHFSMFRNLLEKTSNFLGYKRWDLCINYDINDRARIIRLINFYSHDSLSDLDDKDIMEEEYLLFKETFEKFLNDYKWSDNND